MMENDKLDEKALRRKKQILWGKLLCAQTEEDLDLVYELADDCPEIRQAVNTVKELSADEEMQRLARERMEQLKQEAQECSPEFGNDTSGNTDK